MQGDEAAEKTMSRHGEDECLPQENREVHLEKVAVKVITPIRRKIQCRCFFAQHQWK